MPIQWTKEELISMKAWDRMVENRRFPTKKETLSLELLAQQDVQTLSPEERRRRNKERYRKRKAHFREEYERRKARETPEEREKRLAYAREYYHAHKQLKRPRKEE